MHRMRVKNLDNIILSVLAICLIGITIAYATLSQNLDISGVATVKKGEWNIHFTKLLTPKSEGDATAGKAVLNGDSTVITISNGILSAPGDKITYEFDVINEGDIDAEVELTSTQMENCRAENGTDVTSFCNKIEFELFYKDTKTPVAKGDKLLGKEEKTLNLVITYDKNRDLTSLPTSPIILSDITSIINYTMIKGNSSSTTPSNPSVSIDPSKLPKYEENEVVYFDPINYKLCDNESDTCYAWLVLHGNTDEGKYELVYKNTGVYDYNKALENNGGSYDGVLVNYISKITETWSDKIPKPEAKYNINSTFDFTGLKARIMNTNELSENDNALLNKLSICPASANLPCLIMGESTYYYIMQNTMQSTFGFSGASAPFYINPVIRVDLTTVENIKDYIDDGTIKYVCNEHIYDNGTLSEAEYNKLCKDYIDESLYSTSANSDGTVNISGFKSSTPSSYKNNVWALPTKIDGKTVTGISTGSFAQKGISSKLIISPTIKTIDSNSFVSNSILALALPDSVTSIGEVSFTGNSISTLNIPGSVETIGSNAFNSNNIRKLTLNEGIKTLNDYCFANNAFKSVKLPDSLSSVGIAFLNTPIEMLDTGGGFPISISTFATLKSSLKSLIVGSSSLQKEQTIDNGTFEGFTELQNVTIRKNVKKINRQLFELDSALTNVTLNDSIESIGDYAFDRCSKLKNIKLSNSLKLIGQNAFSSSGLLSVDIPESVIKIGESAFTNTPLKEINLNYGLQTIDDMAFSLSSETTDTINEITIPDSVTTIGNSILGNRVINTLNIGDGVASIDSNMFNKLIVSNLNIGKNSSKSQEILEDGFKGLNETPEKTINIYGSVKKIGINSFGSINIQNLTLNEGITQISMNAFQSNNIKSVTIPSTVTSIGDYAFYNNTNLITANDNSGLLTCSMVSSNTTINNKKNNTSLTCSAN